jgi:flavin prenyltransferase
MPDPIAIVISGASGVVYAQRLLEVLAARDVDLAVLITGPARLVLAHELGVDVPAHEQQEAVGKWLAGRTGGAEPRARLRVADVDDLMDAICSGSRAPHAAVVVPCSMAMLSGIAVGRGDDLAFRLADVMLKERRPLILVPRETPLSLIHLKNMVAAAEAGAVILPAMPGFYAEPSSIGDLVDHVVGKILDQLGLEHDLFKRWGEA